MRWVRACVGCVHALGACMRWVRACVGCVRAGGRETRMSALDRKCKSSSETKVLLFCLAGSNTVGWLLYNTRSGRNIERRVYVRARAPGCVGGGREEDEAEEEEEKRGGVR
jgi:hypothetical protein